MACDAIQLQMLPLSKVTYYVCFGLGIDLWSMRVIAVESNRAIVLSTSVHLLVYLSLPHSHLSATACE